MAQDNLKGNPRQGLVAGTLGFFFGSAAVALYSPAAPQFQETMGLSPTLVGFFVGAPVLFGSLLRIPFSAWCERNGGRKPFLVLLGLSIVGMAGFAGVLLLYYPDDMSGALYPVLFFFGALSGSGIAVFSVGVSQISYWFPRDNQGWALGVYGGIGNIAPGVFTLLVPVMLVALGFVSTYAVWLGLLVLGGAIYYIFGVDAWYFQLRRQGLADGRARKRAHERGQEVFPEGTPIESLRRSARIWKTWSLVGGYFFTFGGFLAMITWLPTYYQEFLGVDAGTAGILVGIFAIYGSLIRVPGGSVSDVFGGERTAGLAVCVVLGGSLLLSAVETVSLAFLGTMIVATGMGVNNAALFKKVPEEIPEAVGGASGWIGGLGAFGGFVIPPVFGGVVSLMGPIGYARGFLIYAALASIGLVSVYTLYQSDSRVSQNPS